MGKDGLLWLFWICGVAGVLGIGVGIGNINIPAGWISGGILSFCLIPAGVEFNNKIIKRNFN